MSEWSDWFEHGCRPVAALPIGTAFEYVHVRRGLIGPTSVVSLKPEKWARVVRYRYRKPAGLVLLERIAENPREMEPA